MSIDDSVTDARDARASRFGRLPWGTLLVEAVFTVVAILLALAADDWRQRREERRLADAALVTFAMELRDNQRRLAAVRPYHDSLAVGFRAMVDRLNRGEPFDMSEMRPSFRGITPPMLLGTAWEAALSTGALRHVDYALVSELAALYESQEELARLNQVMFEQIVSPDVIGRGDYAVAMRLGAVFFADALPLEQRLEYQYGVLRRRLPPVADAGAAATDAARARP